MQNRRPGYRLNSLLSILLLLCLAVLLAWLSVRHAVEVDWTRSGRHTLSRASIEILQRADAPLEITAYAREQTGLRQTIRRFIDMYKDVKPDISLRFINPETVPNEVRRLGIQVNGELVLHYQQGSERVRSPSEREFTHAVQRLLRGSERWLAFIEGHGERNPLGQANHDLGEWGKQLRSRGFRFQPLNLAATGTIPDNTSVLVIASPLNAFLPGETGLLLEYLRNGGNLLWLRDPDEAGGLGRLAEQLQLEFGAGTVLDSAGRMIGINDPTIAMVTPRLYGRHPVLEDFAYTSLYPGATSLSHTGERWQATPLLTSGNHTWLETGPLSGEAGFDEGVDERGPLTLGLALERTNGAETGRQRIVVIGDGDFLANSYLGNAGNLELGMRLINWLSRDEDLITIPARIAGDTQLQMSYTVAGAIGVVFLILLPLLLLGTGMLIWWRRKNR